MRKILVIDDDFSTRKKHYLNVFKDKYILNFTENAKLIFDDISSNKVDIYIIDINLDSFTNPKNNQPLQLHDVLVEIGKSKPIIFISGSYNQLMVEGRLTPIIQNSTEEGYNICSFFVWDEILNASESTNEDYKYAIHNKIDVMINKDKSPYAFGIVCALKEELDPFLSNVGIIDNFEIANIQFNKCIITTINNNELYFVSAYSSYMGAVDASTITTVMATTLNIKNIYMIGVCGGRDSEVAIGDIIIPEESIAYQRGKLTEDSFSVDATSAKPKKIYKPNNFTEIINPIYRKYIDLLIDAGQPPLEVKPPKINYHAMACADYVIDKDEELNKIASFIGKRKLCSVDMESYSIFRVGELLDINTMVIKSVMDLTNKKSDKYKLYAAYIAANYLYSLIYNEKITFPIK